MCSDLHHTQSETTTQTRTSDFAEPSPSRSGSIQQSTSQKACSSVNSCQSQTYPPLYGCEGLTFDKFEAKIQKLCQFLWPAPVPQSDKASTKCKQKRFGKNQRKKKLTLPQIEYKPRSYVVETMKGGGYSNVVGINVIAQNNEIESQMVLRVPQMGVESSEQDVFNLQFVQEFFDLPTAKIIAYDQSENNPLCSPYMLQARIPGHDLESASQSYPDLDHQQKLAFIREFCEDILLPLHQAQFPWIGQIGKDQNRYTVSPFDLGDEGEDLKANRAQILDFFKTRPLGYDELTNPQDLKDQTYEQSALHFLENQFGRYKINSCESLDPTGQWSEHVRIWQKLVTVAQQMDETGCLDRDYTCLAHYDLDPRNIMVEIQDDNTPKITGIIDWDLACFAPDWVACKPPMWIWNWLDGGSEDESKADEEPPTLEQKELKALFDELVGSQFRRYAYQPEYRLARSIFRFARWGLPSVKLKEDADRVVEEWAVLYPEIQKRLKKAEKEYAEEENAEKFSDAVSEQDEDARSASDADGEEDLESFTGSSDTQTRYFIPLL